VATLKKREGGVRIVQPERDVKKKSCGLLEGYYVPLGLKKEPGLTQVAIRESVFRRVTSGFRGLRRGGASDQGGRKGQEKSPKKREVDLNKKTREDSPSHN